MLQPFDGVLGDHLHQLAFLASLGHVEFHLALPLLLEPRADGVHVVGGVLQKDAWRDVGAGVIELLDESGKDFARCVVFSPRHDEVVSAHHLSMSHEKHFDPGLCGRRRHGDYIGIFGGQVQYLLAFVDLLDGAVLVAQHRGALELKGFGCLPHALRDISRYGGGLALQEQHHLINDLGILVLVDRAYAGPDTTVDVEVQAGTRIVAGDDLGTRAVWE